ncbi:nesprin-3 isoform X2 [Varanus komodoensis]|uniref:Spectrin repeat containing nuclear envelope family member 3 n=2 Tax=Varanus komodoensis TaxID=61221 RepID=A0A8D2IZ23_VARKO|nr:nesprin-3 isoform X2 [Varanus komodoensis]XP_044292115.1 nesprin-3 isoform X2 [Varanus komodoensis]
MTQQPQDEFDSSVEKAVEWMKAIEERLRINDNTKGPRAALEARLRDTEKICALEPEGRLKVDLVLMKADALLQCISEEKKHEVLSRLKDIKAKWEETAIYITHCHSRIEWVWLHWSEYLKAKDDFYAWIHNKKVTLEPDIELQLGLKEKQWQLSDAQVLLNDVLNQSGLLERLLEEATSLYNRIGDPSVDEDVQKKMKEEYEDIKGEAQRRVELLGKITKEHEQYKSNIDHFQQWLTQVTERLNGCLDQEAKLPAENRIKSLQDITKDVKGGEKKLRLLEAQSVGVKQNTSPLGAEKITSELEELKKALEKLKLVSAEEEERLLRNLKSENAYHSQARLLEAEILEFRKNLQRLGNSLDPGDKVRSEEDLIALWRRYMATRAALSKEESKIERLKTQLKELFRFSQDVQPLSESVICALREYQSLKGKMFKMSTETETELRQRFQNPLREFQLWKPSAQRLLDTTANVSDPALTDAFLHQIEAFLAESSQFKEQLLMLQIKKDFLSSIFEEEKAKSLMAEASEAAKETEHLHKVLLQRKSKLQSLVSQHKDFDAVYGPLQKKLLAIREKLDAERKPLPSLADKEARLQRLQLIHGDMAECAVQMEELEKLVQPNPTQMHQIKQLSSDYQILKRSLEILMAQSKQHVQEHWTFNEKSSDLQHWLLVTEEELESHWDADGGWKMSNRALFLERLQTEYQDREIQLHLIEAQSQLVAKHSSPEGAENIQMEVKKLKESFQALEGMLSSLFQEIHPNRTTTDGGKKATFLDSMTTQGFATHSTEDANHWKNMDQGEDNNDLQLIKNFDQWLQEENAKLASILSMKPSTNKELEARHSKLRKLQSRVPEGQHHFEDLLRLRPIVKNSAELEELRYQWMLYKSKLNNSASSVMTSSLEEPATFRKGRPAGACSFLRRVCWAALPLQLLLLFLLLLAFLLPLVKETHSCKLANNFAHSFNLMLTYKSPPPT